jgi:signal transduction histidine kinase
VPHHILIVDDEETLLFATQTYLQTYGYQVHSASNVPEATVLLATNHYDLIITDLHLNNSTRAAEGLALISYVRSRSPATRIVLWTGDLAPSWELEARRRGADGLVTKGTPLSEVAQLLRELLGNEESAVTRPAPRPVAEPMDFSILVVDDQEEALVSTCLLLEMEGYRVQTAMSGAEALALFRSGQFQLLIVDYFMPGMNGEQLVQEIRARDVDVQIVLQTGYSGEKPPREMLRLLDIQGYHDKLDGPDRLLLWVEVALKAAAQLKAIRAAEQEIAASRTQLRRLSARLFRLQEEERTQISRELHDHLGQLHATIGRNAEWVCRHCPPDLSALQEPLQETVQLAREAQQATQTLCTLLHPGELNHLGLSAALQEYVADFKRRSGAAVAFSCPTIDSTTLPPESAITIYRIVQEALTNIARHAAATTVTVEGQRHPQEMTVTVADNGKGFTVAANPPCGGLGIVGMHERARLVGGTLAMRSAPGQGTTVVLRVPLVAEGENYDSHSTCG